MHGDDGPFIVEH